MNQLTYQKGTLYYALLFFALTWNFWGTGEVIAPHRQFSELGMIDKSGAKHPENRKFSDFTSVYIPEISAHLQGSRSSWLTLWSNNNECGRPLYHISGFSPAYTLSWLLMQLTDSPWVFITILSLLTCFLAGIFVILFCREIDLDPWAGLIASISLATSPLFLYWLTFPMFIAVWCWAAGALWAISRLAKKPDLLGWSGLAFSSYSLFMTAYPQLVVFHAYLLGSYGLYLAYRQLMTSLNKMLCFLLLALSSLLVGCTLASPVYLDLAIIVKESARIAPDPTFFTVILPKLSRLTDVVCFFILSIIPGIFGNPMADNFPFLYDGLSLTLTMFFFVIISLLTVVKQTWGWWLAIVLFGLFNFMPSLYIFGIKFLGFNLSRSIPLCSIMLPVTIIIAFGVDALFKRTSPVKFLRIVLVAVVILVLTTITGVLYSLIAGIAVQWSAVLLMLLSTFSLAGQYHTPRPQWMILSLVITLASISYPLMLRQQPEHIAKTSPLVETIRRNLPAGSRFAMAEPGIPALLTPNLNAGLGLPSIHSYNSLSPRRYHHLIKALGGEIHTYGRWNGTIAPDYSSTACWMANIGLVLSPTQLTHENLEYLGEKSGIQLHKVISRMGEQVQIALPPLAEIAPAIQVTNPRLQQHYLSSKKINQGDLFVFGVTSLPTSTLLILSQKFHPSWSATALTKQGWIPARVTEINGAFQGIVVPPATATLRLEFKPWVRYAYLAHFFWLFLVFLLALGACKKQRLQACS